MGKIAFLGTGMIGAGLAEAAAKRGDEVTAYNRTAAKARALEAVGVRAAETPALAVRGAERVHVALSDDAAVDAVIDACGDALRGTVVDHTTTLPAATSARAARLEQRGVEFLHAPVFMSPQMCREAKGIMLAAGLRSTFERVEAALRAMTGTLEYAGERRDLAAAYKLFGNAMIFTVTAGLADVYALAAALDVPVVDAHALFSKFNPAAGIAYRGKAMANGDYRPSFELSMARKDTRLMLESAARGERPLHLLPEIARWMDELLERGHASDDLGVLAIDTIPRQTGA
jgi:3-hydroxyisobutyrate dehydrogenase